MAASFNGGRTMTTAMTHRLRSVARTPFSSPFRPSERNVTQTLRLQPSSARPAGILKPFPTILLRVPSLVNAPDAVQHIP